MIESGWLRLARQLFAKRRTAAIARPKAKASATKYHSVGNPRTKMRALPAAKRRPINPLPNDNVCMVMPECHFSAIAHLAFSFHDALLWRPIQGSFFTVARVLYCR